NRRRSKSVELWDGLVGPGLDSPAGVGTAVQDDERGVVEPGVGDEGAVDVCRAGAGPGADRGAVTDDGGGLVLRRLRDDRVVPRQYLGAGLATGYACVGLAVGPAIEDGEVGAPTAVLRRQLVLAGL